MTRNKKMIILLLCLVSVIILYLLIVRFASESEAQTQNSIYMTQLDESSIVGLKWTYDGSAYSLSKEDDTWINPEDSDFQVNQTNVSYMVSSVASISASGKISDVTDLAQYGLDSPQTISLTMSDGKTLDIMLGDYNEVSGNYYAMTSEGDDVYLISGEYVYQFECSMEDLEYDEEASEETDE